MKKYYYVAVVNELQDSFVYVIEAKNKTHLNKKLEWERFLDKSEALKHAKSFGLRVKMK